MRWRTWTVAVLVVVAAAIGAAELIGATGSSVAVSSAATPGPRTSGGAVPRPDPTGATTPPRAADIGRHCFASPRACGFPDPAADYPSAAAVGPHNGKHSVACTSLRHSGSITVTQPGAVVQNVDVAGRIEVRAPDVTIQNVCVSDNAQGDIDNPPAVEFDATGGVIRYSDVSGANATTESVEIALGENTNTGLSLTADHDYLHLCGECVHNDGWHLTNSYVTTNGDPCLDGYSGTRCMGESDHREDVYCDSGDFTATHDTLLDPDSQTAVVFCNVNNGNGGPCINQVTLTDSLLAGGAFLLYTCAHATSVGSSQMTFTGNIAARCSAHATYHPKTGGSTCGSADARSTNGYGYWPKGGYYGIINSVYCPAKGGGEWSDNRWDASRAAVDC